ncbi:MAG: hypothetical protein II595_02805, partial [Desulfovibrio sp.]|nr:hypothetical protein [Desulfovibrio sp.]
AFPAQERTYWSRLPAGALCWKLSRHVPGAGVEPSQEEPGRAMPNHAASAEPVSAPRRRLTALNAWAQSFGCIIG